MEALRIKEFSDIEIEESRVIKRILSGEKEFYEILVRRNNQKLYRVIRSYIKDEVEIEDIMQDSYVKAYTKLYQFKLESSFSTWLIRIGINEALARLKEKGRMYYLNEQSDILKTKMVLEIPDTKKLNPQDKMIRNEAKQFLEDAIDQLDSKYKIVYMMREVEEMSMKEVAIALDLTVANVKVRLHRAKEMLKAKLYEITDDTNIFEFGFGRCDRIVENVMKQID